MHHLWKCFEKRTFFDFISPLKSISLNSYSFEEMDCLLLLLTLLMQHTYILRETFLPHMRSAYINARQLELTSVALKACGFHFY